MQRVQIKSNSAFKFFINSTFDDESSAFFDRMLFSLFYENKASLTVFWPSYLLIQSPHNRFSIIQSISMSDLDLLLLMNAHWSHGK